MRRIKAAVMILGAMGCAMTAGAVDLPFSDGFETGPEVGWVFGTPAVETNRAKVGSYSVYTEKSAKLAVGTGNTQVWFNCYTIMSPIAVGADGEPEITTNAAAFFMNTNGALHAFNSNKYDVIKTGLITNGWHGFSVQLDFPNKTWNIYHKAPDSPSASVPTLINTTAPLRFNTNFFGDQLTMIDIAGKTFLDEVVVTRSAAPATPDVTPPTYAATGDMLNENVIGSGEMSGLSLRYFGTEGTLSGPFGDALGSMFTGAASVLFYDSVGEVEIRDYDGNGGWDGGEFTITPTTGMIVLSGTRSSGATFTAGYNAPSSHTNMLAATGIAVGWNLLAIPFTAGSRQIVNGNASTSLKLPTATAGDQIFLKNGNSWIALRYTELYGWTQIGTQPATVTFPAGAAFWYRNRGSATSWPAHQLY